MVEVDKEQLEKVVAALTHIRLRPGMYFANQGVADFVRGFETACNLMGFNIFDNQQQIWRERGWAVSNQHPIYEMRAKQMDEDDIVEEIFAMLILNIQRTYGISAKPVLEIHDHIRQLITTRPSTIDERIHQQRQRTLKAMDALEKDMGVFDQ